MQGIRIAVDAAGGDQGGRKVIAGALSAARHLGFGLTLVGPVSFIKDELKRQENSIADEVDVRVVSANQVIAMDEGPRAVRRKPNASVKVAAEVVASGDALPPVEAVPSTTQASDDDGGAVFADNDRPAEQVTRL